MRLALVSLMVAVLLASATEAAVSRGNFKDPAHPGKCVVDGLVLNAGQQARHPKRCERILCWNNGDVEFHSCGAVGLPPNKKFGDYKTPNADYPACCDRYIINA
ncbi:uncharacterized protein [Drosophila kikkawai]|uniref:Single domain-containing protein n=1 Tax=Drosophila kikkawai TaxID=30033 RepID=A0A6P4ID33_DROKI|nr:uncharacterized protein LOC108077371 [Drosophila kikkawai]